MPASNDPGLTLATLPEPVRAAAAIACLPSGVWLIEFARDVVAGGLFWQDLAPYGAGSDDKSFIRGQATSHFLAAGLAGLSGICLVCWGCRVLLMRPRRHRPGG